jgi:hypothetical protein
MAGVAPEPGPLRGKNGPAGSGPHPRMRWIGSHVAVLDGIHGRPGVAPLEVALLKDHSPDVRIVALSGESSELDGDVIEQGVFCYLAGCRRDELLRVIEAAAGEQLSPSGRPSIPIEPGSNP